MGWEQITANAIAGPIVIVAGVLMVKFRKKFGRGQENFARILFGQAIGDIMQHAHPAFWAAVVGVCAVGMGVAACALAVVGVVQVAT
ncbi:hypothetical protein [Microbacterium capsulatum]|uniref:Uncharacterized protein n=1 Tax=Microbacterium capsulatum TaxID=3041921 RepID=A0ABU0XHZ1_9MICO|nr:hypothetical protein [Microbacterium sp. ASV81]MDQ4214701.1 hypothetical protein [Microbacterium sp. ASV81]